METLPFVGVSLVVIACLVVLTVVLWDLSNPVSAVAVSRSSKPIMSSKKLVLFGVNITAGLMGMTGIGCIVTHLIENLSRS